MTGRFNAADFRLAETLLCGQAFRWQAGGAGWYTGVIGHRAVRLRQVGGSVEWETATESRDLDGGRRLSAPHSAAVDHATGATSAPLHDSSGAATVPPSWLTRYLSLDRSLADIVGTFPDDPALCDAVQAHWGLRVLRQEPWETLASFIASSTKQIVQIRQIVDALARRFGNPIAPLGAGQADRLYAFPGPAVIARTPVGELWNCKLGFRAKHLLAAAQAVDSGRLDLASLPRLEYRRAREELSRVPGVGAKIAACVLLFSCGFDQAFPVDVWVDRSVRRLYFPRARKITARRVRDFADTHFGPHAGWAQQYLFYDERRRGRGETWSGRAAER